MRLVALQNTTGKQLVISQLPGVVFEVDETKKVSPATLKHPAVSHYIGRGLELVTSPEKVEPKAPVPPIPVAPVSAVPAEKIETLPPTEVVSTVSTVATVPSCELDETVGTNLREVYLSAPGVTEDNVDALLSRFSEIKDVLTAKKYELSDCGVSKADTAALKAWASTQIS